MLAPLSVVQPVGVLAVPVAVVLTAVRTGRRPAGGVLGAVVVCVAGVAVFVGIAAGNAVNSPPPGGPTLIAGLVVGAVVLSLAAVGFDHTGWIRCVSLATGGAVAFGLVSTLLRAVTQDVVFGASALLDLGVLGTLTGLVTALLVGGWLVQQAFGVGPAGSGHRLPDGGRPDRRGAARGRLLGEGAATPAGTWLLLVAAATAATAGVIALARHHPDEAAGRRSVRHGADPVRRVAALDRGRSTATARRPSHSLYRR